MNKWKITKNEAGEIHVRFDPEGGTIGSLEHAITLAKKIAQDEKTLLIVHDDEEATKTDYTNFLTIEEVQGRQENEVKLAKAELTVARALLWKYKNAYKEAKTEEQRELARKAYLEAKERVRKEKINLKNAKKKYASVID
ncbi:hypothetical protein JN01_0326 [Entomoplasma freundtii]|uniref:Uncharacterized protein n=1 Tax=Entomoplasma freundtii TaxID=74700 RepID=A0A2K8NU28_9MOLU|nr:hypothetical protein [Entomoplasma freundtii]ATZ16261.1 hypothetical protein EFREU_v1c02340 [Entomoplasma freundtii]TDY56838.1 hypothetical protein JN01_0326 [Entomoplasma freundtii]